MQLISLSSLPMSLLLAKPVQSGTKIFSSQVVLLLILRSKEALTHRGTCTFPFEELLRKNFIPTICCFPFLLPFAISASRHHAAFIYESGLSYAGTAKVWWSYEYYLSFHYRWASHTSGTSSLSLEELSTRSSSQRAHLIQAHMHHLISVLPNYYSLQKQLPRKTSNPNQFQQVIYFKATTLNGIRKRWNHPSTSRLFTFPLHIWDHWEWTRGQAEPITEQFQCRTRWSDAKCSSKVFIKAEQAGHFRHPNTSFTLPAPLKLGKDVLTPSDSNHHSSPPFPELVHSWEPLRSLALPLQTKYILCISSKPLMAALEWSHFRAINFPYKCWEHRWTILKKLTYRLLHESLAFLFW